MDARQALIQVLFRLTYDITPKASMSKSRSSYGLKHEFEYILLMPEDGRPDRFYFSNSETISALKALGVPFHDGDPNVFFKIKAKVPISWLINLDGKRRPTGESKSKWETYLRIRKDIVDLLSDLIGNDGSTESLFTRVCAQVGYEGQAKSEVPACLVARLASASTTASG